MPHAVASAHALMYAAIGRLRGVFDTRPSSLWTAVLANQVNAMIRITRSSKRSEISRCSARALGLLTVEVAEADPVLHGASRLGGDADQVALGADPLGQLDRGPEGHRVPDAHRERLAAADHDGAGEPLLAEGGDEGPGVLSGRDVLDEHPKDARPQALAVARDLVAGLAQAQLDLVGLRPGAEPARLER